MRGTLTEAGARVWPPLGGSARQRTRDCPGVERRAEVPVETAAGDRFGSPERAIASRVGTGMRFTTYAAPSPIGVACRGGLAVQDLASPRARLPPSRVRGQPAARSARARDQAALLAGLLRSSASSVLGAPSQA